MVDGVVVMHFLSLYMDMEEELRTYIHLVCL